MSKAEKPGRGAARTRFAKQSGLSLVELSIGVVILSIIFFAIGSTMVATQKAQKSTATLMDLDDTLRRIVRRVSEDLRASSRLAEDMNNNQIFEEAEEDGNSNTRFEFDWEVTANSVTFNKLQADGTFSLPITYGLNGTNLERRVMTDIEGNIMSAVIATDVLVFEVAQSGTKVTINVTVAETKSGNTITRSQSITIIPRN